MGFFKTKMSVADYCSTNLATLFAAERETTWNKLLTTFGATRLLDEDAKNYHENLRAAMIELMLIAITKNCSWQVSSDARVFVMKYLGERGLNEIDLLCTEYNGAFGSSYTDGVAKMVQLFGNKLRRLNLGEHILGQLHLEFYGMLRVFTDDVKSVKLIPAN